MYGSNQRRISKIYSTVETLTTEEFEFRNRCCIAEGVIDITVLELFIYYKYLDNNDYKFIKTNIPDIVIALVFCK